MYAYARSSPTKFTDAYGLAPTCPRDPFQKPDLKKIKGPSRKPAGKAKNSGSGSSGPTVQFAAAEAESGLWSPMAVSPSSFGPDDIVFYYWAGSMLDTVGSRGLALLNIEGSRAEICRSLETSCQFTCNFPTTYSGNPCYPNVLNDVEFTVCMMACKVSYWRCMSTGKLPDDGIHLVSRKR